MLNRSILVTTGKQHRIIGWLCATGPTTSLAAACEYADKHNARLVFGGDFARFAYKQKMPNIFASVVYVFKPAHGFENFGFSPEQLNAH